MPGRPLSNNQVAAVLAFAAGLVFLAVEWNGTRIEAELVLLIADLIPGPNPTLVAVARFLAFISPLSAALVIAGAILLLYDRVLSRHKDFALARLEHQVCQGCFMSITPQTLNTILLGRELCQCRNCLRILYLD